MADAPREVWITGVGIVSCLGEGAEAHWQGFAEGRIKIDAERFAPYLVHPLAPLDLDKQIPKKGDQRQMEAWQRIGTYAAGLALADAGVKGNAELLAHTDMIVAAGGGERDVAVDATILTNKPKSANPEAFLNERLMSDLRPTLFLAQLSNLLAGNISIVHGVTGSSRTFMGEEAAGVDAVRVALARIAAGQSELALVGGSHNGEREDLLLLYDAGGHMSRAPFRPVWERTAGMVLGSLGAFLVLESREHAEARNAKPLARLAGVLSERSARPAGAVTTALARMWQSLAPQGARAGMAVISGATGAQPATDEERAWL
jgi:3-oxoacyl-[acyl-carrier-protein] synthase II